MRAGSTPKAGRSICRPSSASTRQQVIDRPIWIKRRRGPALALRLVALKKSDQAAPAARRKARRQAHKERYQVSEATLAAADWVIPVTSKLVTEVTSLPPERFPTADVLAL